MTLVGDIPVCWQHRKELTRSRFNDDEDQFYADADETLALWAKARDLRRAAES
jgi:hypothetical protein